MTGAPLIAIVAGEASGDLLGAGLMRSLKKHFPRAEFVGVGGPEMLAEGFDSLADMERLAVMGLVEPLRRLPELLALRARLQRYFLERRPAVFIGIDAPDFNLDLESRLKSAGIATCHYVCPSVWAWRQGRVKKIRASADHVLALLPFEKDFLQGRGIASTFVGHPLAERLAPAALSGEIESQQAAREALAIDSSLQLLCVMPGSRRSEVDALLVVFCATLRLLLTQRPELSVVIPAASDALKGQIQRRLSQSDMRAIASRIKVVEGRSLCCMQAADAVLLASGTATLEAALLGKPMVVAYRLSALTYSLVSWMLKVDQVALPNLLTETPLVEEFIQQRATAKNLSTAVLRCLDDKQKITETKAAFSQLNQQLARNADDTAAAVVAELCRRDG